MADWMPPAESVDAALLPSLRLGNARADDLVRNNGIAANAVALHKDHIVGHLFLISYRPNWRYLGMRESAAKSLWMRLKLHGQNIAMVFLAKWMPRGSVLLQSSSVKAWAFTPLMVKFFSSLSGTLKPRRFSVPDSRLSVRNGWTRRVCPRKPPASRRSGNGPEWKSPRLSCL